MARGANRSSTTLDAGETRPIAPIGSSLDIGTGEVLYVHWIIINVLIPAAGVCQIQDNLGTVITQIDTSIPNNRVEVFYPNDSRRLFTGRPMPPGSPLIASVTGGQVEIDVSYEVR